jgi:hypothetical protein
VGSVVAVNCWVSATGTDAELGVMEIVAAAPVLVRKTDPTATAITTTMMLAAASILPFIFNLHVIAPMMAS